jgi:hypothetical protein
MLLTVSIEHLSSPLFVPYSQGRPFSKLPQQDVGKSQRYSMRDGVSGY